MLKIITLSLALSISLFPSPGKKDVKKEKSLLSKSSLSGLKFRCIGPALTAGRIADIAVNPKNTSEYYLAVASGGVWKTSNSGTTYRPIFDNQSSYSIGCVTIDPSNENVVWVGTGENNNQRSVAYGDGVYKSIDGGKSWKNMGLKKSEHIGMIAIDPNNSDHVFVAAYGPLWSEGGQRGLYETKDGGKTWNLSIKVDSHTGINEIHMDPENPSILYATSHQRRRHVFTYVGGGPDYLLRLKAELEWTFLLQIPISFMHWLKQKKTKRGCTNLPTKGGVGKKLIRIALVGITIKK